MLKKYKSLITIVLAALICCVIIFNSNEVVMDDSLNNTSVYDKEETTTGNANKSLEDDEDIHNQNYITMDMPKPAYRVIDNSEGIYGKENLEVYYASLVKPHIVMAEVQSDTKLYSQPSSGAEKLADVSVGEKVEILQDKTAKWYLVKFKDMEGWLPYSVLNIPPDSPVNTKLLNREDLEGFANYNEFESETEYFIWVDIDRQHTYVFKGSKDNWKIERVMPCATGCNKSPTTRGLFSIADRGEWFYADQFQSGAKNWVRFNGTYLFHSVAMDRHKNVKEPELGERITSGCVRLSVEDSRWIYENMPEGTAVWVN